MVFLWYADGAAKTLNSKKEMGPLVCGDKAGPRLGGWAGY